MSMYRIVSCVVRRGCLLWPASSLGKILLAFALLHFFSKAKFAYFSRYLLTSILGVSSRSCKSSQNHPTSASNALVVGTKTWITVILNSLPWKWTEIVLSFLRLNPSTAFQSLLLTEGYSISSRGFLPTVVDIMVISIKFTDSSPF